MATTIKIYVLCWLQIINTEESMWLSFVSNTKVSNVGKVLEYFYCYPTIELNELYIQIVHEASSILLHSAGGIWLVQIIEPMYDTHTQTNESVHTQKTHHQFAAIPYTYNHQ